jgi:hypothetical protein
MAIPISNVTRRVVYAASGTGPYAFTFEILANTDIGVYKDDALLTLTTDYTVTIASNGTGSITLTAAPTGATQIAIVGNRTIQRTTDFVTGGDFFANTVNAEMDQQTIFAQQNAEGLQRAMQAPQTDPTSINMTLPRASVRAGKYLSFDDNGNPVAAEGRTEVAAVYAIRDEIVTVAGIDDQVVAVAGNATNVTTVAGISGNVTTVAGISANVTTVANNSSNVTSVAGNATNINTVAGSIANVNTVGTNVASVNTVAGEIGVGQDVTVVAANLSGTNTVGTVATNIANVNAVGTNISNVNAVNSNATNINTVAGQITPTNNVSTVAGVSASVATVAGISSNVTTVAGISSNVTTVAGVSANVTTVAGSIGSVNTVSGSIASVNTNATNIANINQNAANIVAIQNASANATAAAASATTATTQATAAAASAAAASAVVLGNEPVRPAIRPSLLLDFANTEQLDPRITFTRASTATFYDGRTVAKAEENLLLQSQALDQSPWAITNTSVTANTVVSPDGTTTAETLTETSASSSHAISQSVSVLAAEYVFSVFVKRGSGGTAPSIIQLAFPTTPFGSNSYANFDISTGGGSSGTVTLTGAGLTSASITDAGNGWWRCSIRDTASSAVSASIFIAFCNNNSSAGIFPSYAGATTSDVSVWGAQLEQRSSVTAYTATTTQPITNYIPVLLTAAAGVARFEHNPITGESLGLEIEEQRVNLLQRSEEFDNAYWFKDTSSVDANAIVAPNGTQTGEKMKTGASAGACSIFNNTALTFTAQAYTWSVFAKAGELNWITISAYDGAHRRTWFNLATGVVGTNAAGNTATITPVGNGWYRCTVSRTAAATSAGYWQINSATADNSLTVPADSWSGVYIWGAQLEAGAFATSYIPTVASQVTRSADAASMTGANFSSWYNAAEWSIYVEAENRNGIASNTNYHFASISDGTNANSQILRIDASNNRPSSFGSYNGIANQWDFLYGTAVNRGSFCKLALGYALNNVGFTSNAGAASTDVVAQIPTQNALTIGASPLNAQLLNGCIRKIAYYPARVTNAQLQGLTTV